MLDKEELVASDGPFGLLEMVGGCEQHDMMYRYNTFHANYLTYQIK